MLQISSIEGFKMNKRCKTIFRVVGFSLSVFIGLAYLSNVFFVSGANYTETRAFYMEPENSLDVLFVGSSSCVRAVSPMKMWDEYGFASYSRATTSQSPAVTYELLKDALTYQQPKVVVLFCEWLWKEYDYVELEGNVRPAVDGMKISWEKLELVNYICTKDSRQSRLSYLFPFFRYHDRWSELEGDDFKVDFKPVSSYNKGQNIIYRSAETINVNSATEVAIQTYNGSLDFCAESVKYYQKAIDLCKKNNIDVVIVKGSKYMDWAIENSKVLGKFAEENSCLFLDYNYGDFADDLGIKYPDDYVDQGHLNYYGSLKFSMHLGGVLKETYKLPDRRGNKDYQKWNDDLEDYYIQNLKADIVLINNKIQCNIIGRDDIDNSGIGFQYILYKDGEYLDDTEIIAESEYTYEIAEPGTYKIQVYVYDNGIMVNRFGASLESGAYPSERY